MYAVIDLETTGLFNKDRVVEVAIVHVDACGTVTDRWHTLVNPHRDLGPTHVHRIQAADARRAPDFAAIAGDVVARLAGRVPVVHNIAFDSRMLHNEYLRLGVEIPSLAEFGVCTMSWAAEFLPGTGRSLSDCCAAAGIDNDRPHEALSDALVTAELLRVYLGAGGTAPPWDGLQDTASGLDWPELPTAVASPVHRHGNQGSSFLDDLPASSSAEPTPADEEAYLALVDRALLDQHISATEAAGLIDTATQRGIDARHAIRLHERYLRQVATELPADDLTRLADLLRLPLESVAGASSGAEGGAVPRFTLRAGDTIVLTGAFPDSKQHWEQRFSHAGLQVTGYVTKRTTLVVAADPDSMSGKAEKARRYRIPVIRPEAVTRLMRMADH